MHRLHHSAVSKLVPPMLCLLLVLSMGQVFIATAHAQKISQAISVVVVPFADRTGKNSEMIVTKATDAVALALDESQEYVVSTRADTQREMDALGMGSLASPQYTISKEQMVRLGERLRVEKVASGFVEGLAIDKSGACRCVVTVRLLDVDTQEYLDGATSDYTTRAIPGWQGEEAAVINEALRSAAEDAIRKVLTSRTPRGNVDMVDQSGEVIVNLGARDGIQIGTEMLVVRGIWNAAQEKVVLRKIGVIEAKRVEVNLCRCKVVSGSTPRTSDKCYTLYRPTEKVAVAAKKTRFKQYARWLAGVGLLFAVYNTATGNDATSAPGAQAYLTQAAPGAEPRLAVETRTSHVPDSDQTFAWLIFRGETAGFIPQVDNSNRLIAAIQGGKLSNFEDDPSLVVDIEFELTFQYLSEEGDQEDGDVSITYNHLPLVAGRTYYYKLRRIVDPGRVQIPQANSNQVVPPVPVDVSFDIDPPDSLSEASAPAGPVTFFFPPQPEEPSNGNETVDPRAGNTTFRWQPSVGADQYRVMIYNNPQAVGMPLKTSGIISSTSSDTTMHWMLNTQLQPSTEYYWFVAARRSGETKPVVKSNQMSGWILSEPFRFKTILTPPPTPSSATSATGGKSRPSGRGGFFGESAFE